MLKSLYGTSVRRTDVLFLLIKINTDTDPYIEHPKILIVLTQVRKVSYTI